MATETDRAFLQSLQQQAGLSLSQTVAMERGRNLSRAYTYQAFGTLFSSAMKAQPLMSSSPTSSAFGLKRSTASFICPLTSSAVSPPRSLA